MKGITLIAAGHPYYGENAYNLAVSIKANENFPIALLYSKSAIAHLSDQQIDIFDKLMEFPNDVVKNTSVKLLSAWYSPWMDTLVLDVDMIWLPNKKPSDLFKELEGRFFTAITEGGEKDPHPNYFFWADVQEIKEKYELKGLLYQWRTEVMYFNVHGREVVKRAYNICQNHKLSSVQNFGGAAPDELGINIACAETAIEPHIYKWKPSYWHLMHGNNIPPPKVLYEYYLLSMGSNFISGQLKQVYNNLMRSYCSKLKIQHVFDIKSKRNYLPERVKF